MESLDILKGPGTAIYGPSGGGLGGYVNFITKLPQFDGFHEQPETTIGDLAGGGQSWHHYEWTVDSTGPIIPNQLAYRVSYEGTKGPHIIVIPVTISRTSTVRSPGCRPPG
jgi:outer membrane receptor protein involved in Fe transport